MLRISKKISLYIFLGLLAYMPLHIFLSTTVGTTFGVLPVAKVLKDVVLAVGAVAVLFASIQQSWFKAWLQNKLLWLIGAYALLTVVLALFKGTDQEAELLGVVYNMRFLVFFLYGWLLTRLYDAQYIRDWAVRVALGAALVVVVFGIVQYVILPNDALTHLGYTRQNGVLPVFLIDEKPDLERVMSTVRDPNSLGSYLIIVMSFAGAMFLAARTSEKKWWALYAAATLLCLWFTFSRSAWVGAFVAAAVFIFLAGKKYIPTIKSTHKKIAIAGILALLVVATGATYTARNSYFVQNVVLHADQSTVLEDPNELRLRFWRESFQAVGQNPVGSGPGTAGLASIRNTEQGTILNENYYLQIATEVGVVGLALFLAILVVVARRLYLLGSQDLYAVALLASFAGLAVTNFLVHIWANEAVAYTWWGLAGVCLAGLSRKNRVKKRAIK